MPDQIPPAWVTVGLKEVGFHETGDNQGIGEFIKQAKCGKLGDPWCAIWANAKFDESHRSLSARKEAVSAKPENTTESALPFNSARMHSVIRGVVKSAVDFVPVDRA